MAAVLAALIALQVFYWTGPVASDDVSYFNVGLDPFQATASESTQQVYARIAMWLPLRLSAELLGRRWQALLPWPVLAANLALVLVALGALRWWGRTAALVALLSLGLVPQYLVMATVALSDTVAAMFGLAGLLLIAPALLGRDVRRAVTRCVFGGLLIGLGYSAKEATALFYPGLALFVLLWRTRQPWAWQRLSAVAVGALLFLSIEAAALWAITGDPLFHLHSIRVACRAYGSPVTADPWPAVLWYVSDYLRWLLDPRADYGGWGLVYLAALILALRRPTDLRRLLLCCALVGLAYLSAGTVDLADYFPINHQPRYLIPLMPLLALLTADVVTTQWHAGGLRRTTIAAIAVVLCLGSLVWPDRLAGRMYRARTFHAARALIDRPDPPWTEDSRFIASKTASFRLSLLGGVDGVPSFDPIQSTPASPESWQARYAGCYVWVTKEDREQTSPLDGVYLGPAGCEALQTFPCVRREGPPISRLNQLRAALGSARPSHDSSAMVEVYHVPNPPEPAPAGE